MPMFLPTVQASAADKDNFFSRKIAENASRPEGLPPSQGACAVLCCAVLYPCVHKCCVCTCVGALQRGSSARLLA